MRSENLRRPLQPRRHPAAPRRHPGSIQRHPSDTPAAPGGIRRHPGDKPEKTGTPQRHELLRLCEKPLHAPQVTVSIFLKNCELYHRSMYCESKLNSYLGGNRPQCELSANPNSH